jgi:hypothetical protein
MVEHRATDDTAADDNRFNVGFHSVEAHKLESDSSDWWSG